MNVLLQDILLHETKNSKECRNKASTRTVRKGSAEYCTSIADGKSLKENAREHKEMLEG
jgi:hypothetical protein